MYIFFSFFLRYIVLVHEVLWLFIDIHCTYLFHLWLMYVFRSPTLSCVVSFLHLYTCFLLFVCNLPISVSHKDALMSFVLKCFRNTGCQSLLAINTLPAKVFKSLWYDRFYCIQQVNMSWVIYDFSHMLICLLWFCHRLPKGEIVRTYVFHMLGSYVTILCNWLILWQNILYL